MVLKSTLFFLSRALGAEGGGSNRQFKVFALAFICSTCFACDTLPMHTCSSCGE